MKKITTSFLLFVLLFILLSCKSTNNNPLDFTTAPITGMIYSRNNNACASARVVLSTPDKKDKIVFSDIYGRFTIAQLEKGPHSITVFKQGFETNTFDFSFINRTQSIYVYMISEPDLIADLEKDTEAKAYIRATKTGERLLELNPDSSRGLFLTAGAYMKLGEYEKSLSLIDRLKALEPDSIWPVLLTADMYENYMDNPLAALEQLNLIHPDKRDEKILKRIQKLEIMTEGVN